MNIEPIKMEMFAKKDGSCDIKINDSRFSNQLHGKMVYHIYRHVCYVTTHKAFNENSVAIMMIMIEDQIFEKLGLEIQVIIDTDGLDNEIILNYYSNFERAGVKAA